jgi:GNAT superfamily N-acetyltransferase
MESRDPASSACEPAEAALIDASLRDFSLAFASLPGGLSRRGPDVHWCYSGAPRLNRVLSARFPAATADHRIDEVLSVFGSRGVPASWYVSPLDSPDDLAARLERRGLALRGIWTGMSIVVDQRARGHVLPTDAKLRRAADDADATTWAETAAGAFAMSPESARAFVHVIAAMRPPETATWRRYVGYWQDAPVATAALYADHGVAGIYYVGAVPSARRRGFATELTLLAMEEARALGYPLAVLQASPAGVPVYVRIGFHPVSAIRLYDYQPSRDDAGASAEKR